MLPSSNTAVAERPARLRDATIHIHDVAAAPWVEAGKPGLHQKLVRGNEGQGEFLGLLGFDALVASGLHQHTGVTSSYMLGGSLTDHWDTYKEGVTGINLEGSTHDAMCYCKTSMVNRLEAPVLYPQDFSLHTLHHGSRHGDFGNPAPELTPTLSIEVARVQAVPTAAAGVTRRMIFDYGRPAQHGRPGAAVNHRHVCLTMLPRSRVPVFKTSALTEFFVLGGEMTIDGRRAGPANFVIVEPGTEVAIGSEFGCTLLAWADGPTAWSDLEAPDLFGF
ncbi:MULTISPECIES: cupin domain-containing protein [unclassified Variovorax]|jgi:hypothetical protein|uniref:cupin domain-containing protein n=1 Tax=Variovorax TaxID=34072 RepID=UPI0008ECE7DA|nr:MULTISPECIES: hypothetical protein [unclassified Variovorax]TAJ60473.1 MAG: anti-sigma factor [Variovorax sp.]SFO77016.1 hypothetical protein SAMN05443579_10637 [Variovorax sp. PDC80]